MTGSPESVGARLLAFSGPTVIGALTPWLVSVSSFYDIPVRETRAKAVSLAVCALAAVFCIVAHALCRNASIAKRKRAI